MIIDKVVHGDNDIYIPAHLSYGKYLLEKLQNGRDEVALINGETGQFITYSEIFQKTVNTAASLLKLGIKKGDVVAVCSENRFEFMISTLGIICCGAVVTTASVSYTRDELIHVMGISKPKYVFCSPNALKTHFKSLKFLRFVKSIISFGDEQHAGIILFKDLISKDVDAAKFEPVDVQGQTDTAVILYSSGTTGLPKGVMLTHLNMLFSACNFNEQIMNDLGLKKLLTIVPWYHAYGLMSTLNLLSVNRTLVCLSNFIPEQYLKTIQDYKIDLLLVVPPIVVYLGKSPLVEKYDVSSVKRMWCGAAPLTADIVEATKKKFPNLSSIIQAYGMTETALAVTKDIDNDQVKPKPGSGGYPLPGVKLKVVDIKTKQKLGPFKQGEICVKGANNMKGYIGDKVSTVDIIDQEGFLKTGDIGYYDNDGYLFIVDRLKELIKYKGYQVPPAEVENIILQHPAIQECGVVGAPNVAAGELTTAFIVLRPNAKITEQEIIDFVASKISHAKQLHGGVIFVNDIPKNQTGKILRRALKELLTKKKSKL